MTHWYDEKQFTDAPEGLGIAEADAWADGYNAAVAAYTAELDEAFQQEQKPTPRQTLVAHLQERHKDIPPMSWSREALARWHAQEHWRFWADHMHAGSNTGPGDRPPGWKTGEDVRERQ